jgi:hypothetical protein
VPETERLIAACGLDCTDCDMRQATTNPELQRTIARWFKEKRNRDVKPEEIHCTWCKGDRSGHWSADCWILKCCVDGKGLHYCSECPQFPCPPLGEWSRQNDRYGRAYARLLAMRSACGSDR